MNFFLYKFSASSVSVKRGGRHRAGQQTFWRCIEGLMAKMSLDYFRKYYQEHKERIKEKNIAWRLDHAEQVTAYEAKRSRHPDRRLRSRFATLKAHGLPLLEIEKAKQAYQIFSALPEEDRKCALCGRGALGSEKHEWAFDHDHDLLVFRGIIHNSCNRMLGFSKDDPERLRAAASYLEARRAS